MVNGSDLWISRQDLDRIVESVNQVLQSCTSITDLLGFTQSLSDALVLVDSHVQVSLQGIL